MGKDDAGVDQGGGGCSDIGPDIIGCGSIGPIVRVRDMGDVAAHKLGVGRIPPQGGPQDYREATSYRVGLSVGIPPL